MRVVHRTFTRRRYLELSGAGIAAPAFVPAPARAAQFQYKLGNSDPPENPINVRLVQWANAVKAETNGRMEISIFPHNQLGNQSSLFAQVRQGSLEFTATINTVYAAAVPVAAIDSVGYAFATPRQPVEVMDGALGAYVRKEFAAKGIYVFEKIWENGMRQTCSSSHPIRTASDWSGVKIRTPPAKLDIDLFATLGAAPTPLDSAETYTALQTHLIDAAQSPVGIIETEHYYEVQKYLSLTNHQWAAYWLVANAEKWNALPPDIRAAIERNAAKYALLERNDVATFAGAIIDKLHRQGMQVNSSDVASMRAKLGPYYARCKSEFGPTVWALLEAKVGRLA